MRCPLRIAPELQFVGTSALLWGLFDADYPEGRALARNIRLRGMIAPYHNGMRTEADG